jgi:hypothetical protein
MATTALQAAARVSSRARDPGFTATAKEDVYNLLTRMQAIVNGATGSVIQSAVLSVDPSLPVYSISGLLPNALRIVDVRGTNNQSLDGPIPYQSLKYLSSYWWRETGPQLLSWSLVGKDTLILRPSQIMQTTVTVYYVAVTAPLLVDSDEFQIPDEDIETVLDPVEFLLDLKARDYDNCKVILDRWSKVVQDIEGEVR